MTDAVLGIDIGTRATKAVLMRADGVLLAATSAPHAVASPRANYFEHDADTVWWADTLAVTRAALQSAPDDVAVAAVGLSACGPCIVPVDIAGNALRPGILYGVDTRAGQQIAALEARIGHDEILRSFGMPITSQAAGPKVDWLAENEPEVYARTAHLLTANGYIASRLTGRRCMDHHQAAYFAPYYRNGAWDATHDRAGVVRRLPDLLWSDEIAGTVSASASAETGLRVGTPVVIGSSDGLTGAYGAGAQQEGDAVLNYGTTVGVTLLAPRSSATGGVWRTPGAFAGQDCVVGALSTGGVLTSWFLEQLGRDLPRGSADEISAAYQHLEDEARVSPAGADGLLLLPYFAGERTPIYDPGAAGVLLGLRLHHTRGDMYRAVLEGTAYGVRHVLDEMNRLGADVENVRAVGGGTATKLWQQVVSDVTGRTQATVTPYHGAPVGAALFAARGINLISNVGAARWVRVSQVTIPDDGLRAAYDVRFAAYLELYKQTRSVLHQLDAARDG